MRWISDSRHDIARTHTTMTEPATPLLEAAQTIAAVRSGDDRVFDDLLGKYRREIHVHCYRLVGSFDEAEEHTQETFLRAWRARSSFKGRATFRGWLYKIATNVCLDAIKRRPERRLLRSNDRDWVHGPPPRDLPWMQPYPDALLDAAAPEQDRPDSITIDKESLGLAVLATVQLLPPRQRAVLILREVLDWSAQETAALLETSVPAVNSALQRARATMGRRDVDRASNRRPSSEVEHALVARYIDAHHRADPDAIMRLVRSDIRMTMPPDDICLVGAGELRGFFDELFDADEGHEFRLIPTRANGQPAAANYLRRHPGEQYRAFSIDVLRLEGTRLAEITTFFVPEQFAQFGLPPEYPA